MENLIGLFILGIIFLIRKVKLENQVDNYPIDKVSIAKMGMDAGKSPEYIQRQMVSGAYDKDADHPY